MNNFVSVFEELSKLYEADELEQEVAVEEVPEDEVPVEEAPVEEPKKVILECSKCGALVIKDEADVKVDEETDLANIEDECVFCEEAAGYTIVGAVVPYEAAETVEEDDAVVEEAVEVAGDEAPAAADSTEKAEGEEAPEKSGSEELVEDVVLTEGKIKDSLKKVATRLGADGATIMRGFAELVSDLIKNDALYDAAEYVENKAVLKALESGNEKVLNTCTKEDIEELKKDIEDYKKSKADKKTDKADDEELEELLDVTVDARGFGGEGNDVSVL